MKKERQIQRAARVVKFLHHNPLSTADEVFKATGLSVSAGRKFVKSCIYEGKRCWRVNRAKLKAL